MGVKDIEMKTIRYFINTIVIAVFLCLFFSGFASAEYSFGLDDPALWVPVPEHGRVEKVIYDTHWYSGESAHPFQKEMCIYLPYGYNNSKQYNVLVLLPGMDMPSSCYLSRAHRYSEDLYSVQFQNVLDNAIAQGLIQPTILVTFPYYGATIEGHPNMDMDGHQLINELRYDVLPYVVRHYSTYARTPDVPSIVAAREHFAIFGFSYTSTIILKYIMPKCMDLFSRFGASSVFCTDLTAAAAEVNGKLEAYPVYGLYVGCGDRDDACSQTKDMYRTWISLVPRLKEVSDLVVLNDTGHDARTYDTAIYNCLTQFR